LGLSLALLADSADAVVKVAALVGRFFDLVERVARADDPVVLEVLERCVRWHADFAAERRRRRRRSAGE
jgi:hypothetical protein